MHSFWDKAKAVGLPLALAIVATLIAIGYYIDKAKAADKGGDAPSFLDLPAVAASPWTGCWFGGTLGYATQSTDIGPISFSAKDVTYGVGAGCDGKLGQSNLVVGVMADIDWTKADSAIASYNYSWFGGARFGVLVSPTTLMYGLAGYTSLDGSIPSALINSQGLTLGAGAEAMLSKSWSLKAEYRYVDLGDEMGGAIESTQHAARLSLNYRFGTK